MNSIRIGVDVTPLSIRFDMYGRLTLTWHLTGSLLKVSAFRVWFQGTKKLKSAYLSRFHQLIRSLLIIEAYTKRQEKRKANHADPLTTLVPFYREPRQIS